MNNKITVFTFLIICVCILLYMVKKRIVWEDKKSVYNNTFSLRAFLMLIFMIIILVALLFK